jgi:excisionase family DNA binding protein
MSTSLASSGCIKIIHGANDGIFNVVGASVASVQASLVDAFNIPAEAVAFVNGELVGDDLRLQANFTLEFVKQAGRKGVGDKVWTDEEFCIFFKITPEDLQAWIAQGLKVRRSLDGSLRITESDADDFFRGPVVESPYLTSEQAAAYLRTTIKGVYSLLERGKLKKLPGSRTVLFTREMLDAYLQGGDK